MPEVRDELGAPKIVTGSEYLDALSRLGYNVDNMNSPLPIIQEDMQRATNLINSQYQQYMNVNQSAATVNEATARANQAQSEADYNNASSEARIQGLKDDSAVKTAQADEIRQRVSEGDKTFPYRYKQIQNATALSDTNTALAQRQADLQNDAITAYNQSITELPDPSSPTFVQDRAKWEQKYSRYYNDPTVGKALQDEIASAAANYGNTSSAKLQSWQRDQILAHQENGNIPMVVDTDKAITNGQATDLITQGNMNQARHTAEAIAGALPDNDPYKQRLNTLVNQMDGYIKGNLQDVQAGKASDTFDTNGNLTGNMQGAVAQAQQHLKELIAAGSVKPTAEATIPIGPVSAKTGKAAGEMKITGTLPDVLGISQQYGLKTPDQERQASMTDDQKKADIFKRASTGQISWDEAKKELGQIALPSGVRQPGMPGSNPSAESPATQTNNADTKGMPQGRVAPSNNDYIAPTGVGDTANIDANVWQSVMSEEGAEPGLDPGTNHMSVFGVWKDAAGAEGDAYRTVMQYGPRSKQAYDAVTKLWTSWAQGTSEPWKLNSPGLQELVIADTQHKGSGAGPREILNQMAIAAGGNKDNPFETINKMDPSEAILRYSEARSQFWKGNQSRVIREGRWAMRNNGILSGQKGQPGQVAQASQ